MSELQRFPFEELVAEGIWAEQDPPSIIESRGEDAVGLRLSLRSDSKEERSERKAWPQKRLKYTKLEALSVNGCTPELFESICMLPSLRKLSIQRGRVPCIDGLEKLPLTHFYFCGNPKLTTLHPIGNLKSLIGLSLIGNYENVRSLDPLENLQKLESLMLGANNYCSNHFETLTPIGRIKTLRHVAIISTKVERDGIFPVGNLQGLEYLYLEVHQLKQWSVAEYQHLDRCLPKLKGNMIRLAARDAAFQRECKIR